MKTLRNHTIVYDDECPLCDLYTGAFVKTGMLDGDGRVPFSKMPVEVSKQVDHRRACNEIALVNTETGKVIYGIESLMTIVISRYDFLRPLFAWNVFRWLMKKFYSFISYNRKV